MMDRRLFLSGMAALVACKPHERSTEAPARPNVKRMAITMDDFHQNFTIGLSVEERNENILNAFDTVGHKAAGFVTGSAVNSPWGETVLKSWRNQGHLIGNHTWSHSHANEVSTKEYITDTRRNSALLSEAGLAPAYFRFPFLDDGRDRAQQEALFGGLDKLELINAPVTFDTVDWYTTSRLEDRLRDNPNADLMPYRDYYVTMCVTLANYWNDVAQTLGFVDLPHLTLMHHNILNGLFLKDVLLALQADGWTFVDAREALAFELYHDLPPEPTHGRNWLTLKRLEMGLNFKAYPEEYQNTGRKTMDALGL